MPVSYKILGQVVPSNSFVTLYKTPTSPASGFSSRRIFKAIVSNISISNADLFSARAYTIRVVPNGESGGVEHEIFSSVNLPTVSTHFIQVGLTLESGDSVEIKMGGTHQDVSFSAFGSEIY